MNKKLLFIIWGALFTICAAFGFIGQPGSAVRILGILFSFGFFGLGGIILWQAHSAKDRATSLFLWACLMVVSQNLLKKKKH